jgi:hypothetical protein
MRERGNMKTLLEPADRAALARRLARLQPDSARRWGRMTAPQMVCHLADAFRGVLGERSRTASVPPHRPVRQTLIKWLALYAPVRWPRGLKTRPEADQEQGGTRPTTFADDRLALDAACDRFVQQLDVVATRPHFLFGMLSPSEWARWGYLHMDHHLRQFGV